MRKILIVDFMNTLLRSLAVNANLANERGVSTGGFYGVLTQLTSKINKHQPDVVVFCSDTRPYYRTTLYPDYKGNRKTSTPEWATQIKDNVTALTEFLELCKITHLKSPGLEADDLIALLIQANPTDMIFVLSNDNDLFQLLTTNQVQLLRNSGLYNKTVFYTEYPNLEPEDWVLYTALQGTHNNVKGIPKCGPKKALKYTLQLKQQDSVVKIKEYQELIERNKQLITLPFKHEMCDLSSIDLTLTPNKFNFREIARYCHPYGIKITQSMTEAFDKMTFPGFRDL